MKTIFTFISFIIFGSLSAQVTFNNPSFEGEPQDATVPVGWIPCAPYTTPDILPGYWGVYNEPSDGDTFVGLITRKDGTFESIAQRTKTELTKDFCYVFQLDLAHSSTYAGFNGNIKLKIWGGNQKCVKDQLLFVSPIIKQNDWETYKVEFKPKNNIKYIIFEAFFSEENHNFYNGNILIDNISVIAPCGGV